MGRSESLEAALKSLNEQTYKNFETILVTDKGELAKLRNQGAQRAKGAILAFIDDDVVLTPSWLETVVKGIASGRDVGGISGPSIIRPIYRRNRDLFRYPIIKALYDKVFLEGIGHLPGHFTRFGAWTTGACEETCSYEGEVEFLEACNMSFRRNAFEQAGGFDESFKGVGDYSEPDLSFRIRRRGYRLLFLQGARLFHNPSKAGAYGLRLGDSQNRLRNFNLFADRHIRPSIRLNCYKVFLSLYYGIKATQRYTAH